MIEEIVKSELQLQLEAEGWRSVGNEKIADSEHSNGYPGFDKDSDLFPTSHEVRSRFSRWYTKVELKEAFSPDGTPLDLGHNVAVYVKGERTQPQPL